jgi:hypothetical protein
MGFEAHRPTASRPESAQTGIGTTLLLEEERICSNVGQKSTSLEENLRHAARVADGEVARD